jgi:ubiquinone biosynthesis UbiH/UbiF/VisC/COQ6 family hydroxylase
VHSLDFDSVIVGGGLVGLSLARALAGSGLTLGVVDGSRPAAPTADGWDARVYAISPASEAFLRTLGAWPEHTERLAPVTKMRVFGDRAGSDLTFSAYEAHVARLATIIESSVLVAALHSVLQDQPGLALFSPARCAAVEWGSDQAELRLDSGETLRARLLVAADGADSWLRGQAGVQTAETRYDQTAVVANFSIERPHRDTAFQWFRTDGVLALLPLPGDRASLVWSAQQDLADRLLSLDAADLAAEVSAASRDALGRLTIISPASAFPLRLIRVSRLVAPRLALVGDAAHNFHPLAGQGVNLGFQDARELAAVLCARGQQQDVGSYPLLRRYERWRRSENLLAAGALDALERLFSNADPFTRGLRAAGLSAVGKAPFLKRRLAQRALGVSGDVPTFLKVDPARR